MMRLKDLDHPMIATRVQFAVGLIELFREKRYEGDLGVAENALNQAISTLKSLLEK